MNPGTVGLIELIALLMAATIGISTDVRPLSANAYIIRMISVVFLLVGVPIGLLCAFAVTGTR